MNYNLYQAEDFASNESFIAYYLRTDDAAIQYWEDWISRHPEKMDEIFNAEQLLSKLNIRLPEEEFDQEFERFESFLKSESAWNNPIQPQRRSFKGTKLVLALSIFVVCLLTGLFFYYQGQDRLHSTAYIVKQNGFGKISRLWLSDGTKVTLNANSSLKFPKAFNTDHRDVELQGEAFFEVAKDKNRPFTVFAKGTQTHVLGTKFNVSAYTNEELVKVALVEGSIELQARETDKVILKPAEMATYSSATGLTLSSFNHDEVTAWKDGILVFHNAPFEEIAKQFKRMYNIELINESKVVNWSYSGQFDKADYISVIKNICFAKNLKFIQQNQTITLKSKR
ncbi:FecR family protein [Pedobacter rhizosphaerae]|uniref:FecR family protein n=1 Tax=Pedobacter rhizosphaerae TaxID=390241 RepID=A0A1H9LGA7_9SPHI|nr:FecR family protein [Pedobacter rhizosphaerae]SER10521.1 FecR family protein [Pedobacter rhizosphaerae]